MTDPGPTEDKQYLLDKRLSDFFTMTCVEVAERIGITHARLVHEWTDGEVKRIDAEIDRLHRDDLI